MSLRTRRQGAAIVGKKR